MKKQEKPAVELADTISMVPIDEVKPFEHILLEKATSLHYFAHKDPARFAYIAQ